MQQCGGWVFSIYYNIFLKWEFWEALKKTNRILQIFDFMKFVVFGTFVARLWMFIAKGLMYYSPRKRDGQHENFAHIDRLNWPIHVFDRSHFHIHRFTYIYIMIEKWLVGDSRDIYNSQNRRQILTPYTYCIQTQSSKMLLLLNDLV